MSVLTLTLPRPQIDEASFRDAMARLASGVAVVACWDGDTPHGLLVSSLTALSTEPPRVLFCVSKRSSSHAPLLRTEQCSLSLLAEGDRREAERFSRRDLAHERFDADFWGMTPGRPPQPKGGLVTLNGFVDQKLDAGSHSIFILRIEDAQAASLRRPLVYFDRAFHRLTPPGRQHGPGQPPAARKDQDHDRP
jgi:flavin reductase